jgi:hypothetical protein
MRTTLNIDDDLMDLISRRFPSGTPKTVIIEESLRIALAAPASRLPHQLAPDVAALVARGLLIPAARTGVPPQSVGDPLPAGKLLRDLAGDREDR